MIRGPPKIHQKFLILASAVQRGGLLRSLHRHTGGVLKLQNTFLIWNLKNVKLGNAFNLQKVMNMLITRSLLTHMETF